MPSTSRSQQRLFGWALACKKGESKHCPANVKKLADSMSNDELEKYASTSHNKLPESIQESIVECISEMDATSLDLLEKETYSNTEDVKTPPQIDKNPQVPPGYEASTGKRPPMTPSLYKAPMGKAKNERRLMNFDQFLDRINYRTHDGVLQKGHGQNLTGKG
jgi:hypothetical protein